MKTFGRTPVLLAVLFAILPAPAICVNAAETDNKPQYISIEILDARADTSAAASSITGGDDLLTWRGAVSIEMPEPREDAPLPAEEPAADAAGSRPGNQSEVPLYFQTDYPDVRYGSGTVATSGCSITCLAMMAAYLTEHPYSPAELADYFGGRAYSNIARLETGSQILQLPHRKAENWHETLQALQEGKVAILLVGEASDFTESQHFIVLPGITEDGRILVNDPYLPNYSRWELQDGFRKGFPQSQILQGYSGAWIYDKGAMPDSPFLYREDAPVRENRYENISLSAEEMDLLAKVVWVEARGESFEGQQAVAEVVLNRMASGDFPSSLHSVIYAEGQFRSVPHLEDAAPWQAQFDAIDAALYGPYVLPMDVMYFAQTPTNDHVWGEIGGHVFCYQEATQ